MDTHSSKPVAFPELLREEWQAIRESRQLRGVAVGAQDATGPPAEAPLWGLALSGGGIRSASFAFGVLQSLAQEGVLSRIDYLSTVSGGGYTGAALTWFTTGCGAARAPTDNQAQAGGNPAIADQTFSFLGDRYRGARPDSLISPSASTTESRGGPYHHYLEFLRQRGGYLTPGAGLGNAALLGLGLRTMFLGISVHFALLLGVTTLVLWLAHVLHVTTTILFGAAAALVLLAWVLLSLRHSVRTATLVKRAFYRDAIAYDYRTRSQVLSGTLVQFAGVLVVLAAVAPVSNSILVADGLVVGVFAGTSGALLSIWSILNQLNQFDEARTLPASILLPVAAALLIFGLLLASYEIAHMVLVWSVWATVPAGLMLLGLGWVLGTFVNLNYISIHRMYRDRLMETFLPDPDFSLERSYQAAMRANVAELRSMQPRHGPLHLINTHVNLNDDEDPRFRNRGGDNFVLSPVRCGSDATLWYATAWFSQAEIPGNSPTGPMRKVGLTLATAMAISGAAVNPGTGLGGRGVTRNIAVSFLMSLLNLRLGYWLRNPSRGLHTLRAPDYIQPGLQALLGGGYHRHAEFLELSDGGHFDNTGLYELIRRRTTVIIFADGGADTGFTFSDLANAVERVRVDFGAHIHFNGDHDTSRMVPGRYHEPEAEDAINRIALAEDGFAIARIEYPPLTAGKEYDLGILVMLKTTLIRGLPADLISYRREHPSFPDEPTQDQFFDEPQFEAYRELGYQIAKGALRSQAFQEVWERGGAPSGSSGPQPHTAEAAHS